MKMKDITTTFLIIFITVLRYCWSESEPEPERGSGPIISGCRNYNFRSVMCVGNFNLSDFLETKRPDVDLSDEWENRLDNLQIFNSSILEIGEHTFNFYNFTFEKIWIENAPNLNFIHPNALIHLKNTLTDFRAINTSLPNLNDHEEVPGPQNPFKEFTKLSQVYVGEQSYCPEDASTLWPCRCQFGRLSRAVPSGLYGTTWGISNQFAVTTHISCSNKNMSGDHIKDIFERISKSDHKPQHFDVFSVEGQQITSIPSNVFSNVSITAVWMAHTANLSSIHPNAFGNSKSAKSIQLLEIEGGNFANATACDVQNVFQAFTSLSNIRYLRINQLGLPYIPPIAFVPKHGPLLRNLRYLTLSFDRKRKASSKFGIKSIGSYAFSGAPSLIALGLLKNFIEKFDSYAFAFNESSKDPLQIDIGGNPFNDSTGLAPNAFSGSKREVRIKFDTDSFAASDPANDPTLNFFPENVFRPFIEGNPGNYYEVDHYNVDIWCDCGNKWTFQDNGLLKPNVEQAIRIKRVQDNLVSSDPSSFECKSESSFECLPRCLVFPSSSLIHCGGSKPYDVVKEFKQLESITSLDKITKLKFSSKGVIELPKNSFGNFKFQQIEFAGCRNLSFIHNEAFGASAAMITRFSASNTSLTSYPNFGTFPNLEMVQLDDYFPYNISQNNFKFPNPLTSNNTRELKVFLDKGTINPSTFSDISNDTTISLYIGKRKDCSTIACLLQCSPTQMKIQEKFFRPLIQANPKNTITTTCYLECSCELEWIYKDWQNIRSQFNIWVSEYMGQEFYCVPRGTDLHTDDNFFGIDTSKFNNGSYFAENNCLSN